MYPQANRLLMSDSKPGYFKRVARSIIGDDPYGGYGQLVDQHQFGDFIERIASYIPVTEETAMQVPAVYSGVSFIADVVGFTPIKAYKLVRKDKKEERHPLGQSWDYILNCRWNECESSFQSIQRLIMNIIFDGCGYIYLSRNPYSNLVRELYVLDSRCVSPRFTQGTMLTKGWDVNVEGLPRFVEDKDIVYIPKLPMSFDYRYSYGILRCGRRAIANSLALMAYQGGFFDSIAAGRFFIESPFQTGEKHDKYTEQIAAAIQNMVRSRHGTLVMPKNTKVTSITADNRRSQMHETKIESIREISRLLGLPKVLLNEYSDSTWTMQDLSTLLTNLVIKRYTAGIQKALQIKLFNNRPDNRHLLFDLSELQRSNPQSMAETYNKEIFSGQKTLNEIRMERGLMPDPHPYANELIIQSASVPLSLLESIYASKTAAMKNGTDPDETDPEPPESEEKSLYIVNRLRQLVNGNGE